MNNCQIEQMPEFDLEGLYEKVDEAIEYWLDTGDNEKLKVLVEPLENLWEAYAFDEEDFRSGKDTYGYETVSVKDSMIYISDRWRCAFRLRWLLDGLENGAI